MKLYLPDGNGGYKEVEMESETCVINIENIIEDQTPPYELPTMSETLKGGAAVGNGLFMLGDTLNAEPLLTMTEAIKGGAKVGQGLYMTGETLNANPIPTMNNVTKGGAKLGNGLYMIGESLNAEPIQTMSESVKGGAKVGTGLYMSGDVLNAETLSGTQLVNYFGDSFTYLNGELNYELPTMSETLKGGAKVGTGLYMSGEWLNVKLGEGFSTGDDGEIEFDPLEKISLGPGLDLDDDGNLTFNPIEGFPSLGDGLGFDDNGVLTVSPFAPITLGDGFNFDGGELTFNPLDVIPLGDGLTLKGGTLNVNPAIFPTVGSGDTIVNVVENSYELPTMSETLKGGAKVGIGLYMTEETLNADVDGLFSAILNTQSERAQARALTTNVQWGDVEVYDSQHRRIGKVVPPVDYPPDWRDELPPLTFAIPNEEPPYCAAYGVSSWAGGGLLILSEEWYYHDFKLYGDDDEELFTTNEQTYMSGWFPGDTSDSQVEIEGDGHTLVDEEDVIESETNIAETKNLINGQTIVRITRYTFRHHLQQSRITAKWHSKEQLSFVSFAGSVHAELPPVSTRGSITYVINEAKLYLYDGEKWLPFSGGGAEQAEQGEESE